MFKNSANTSGFGTPSSGFASPPMTGQGFGPSGRASNLSSSGSSPVSGHGFGPSGQALSSFGSGNSSTMFSPLKKPSVFSSTGRLLPPDGRFGIRKVVAPPGLGPSSQSAHGFGYSQIDANPSDKPFGSSSTRGPPTPDSDSLPFGHGFGVGQRQDRGSSPILATGFGVSHQATQGSSTTTIGSGVDHQPTPGSSTTRFGTKVRSSQTSATEDRPFGTKVEASPNLATEYQPFGTTSAPVQSVSHDETVASNTSVPASGTASASAPAQPLSNTANAYLLKELEQLAIKSEGTISAMKMLEILMRTHANLVKALEQAKAESENSAANAAHTYLLKTMEQLIFESKGTIPEMKMLEILMQTHAGLVKAIEAAKVESGDDAT